MLSILAAVVALWRDSPSWRLVLVVAAGSTVLAVMFPPRPPPPPPPPLFGVNAAFYRAPTPPPGAPTPAAPGSSGAGAAGSAAPAAPLTIKPRYRPEQVEIRGTPPGADVVYQPAPSAPAITPHRSNGEGQR